MHNIDLDRLTSALIKKILLSYKNLKSDKIYILKYLIYTEGWFFSMQYI